MGDGEASAVTADEDGNHQRSAGETELDRHRHARNRDGNGAEGDAEGDAEEEFGDVRDLQVALGVTEGGNGGFDMRGITDDGDGVTELQAGVAVRDKFDTGTHDAADVHAVALMDVERGELFVADGVLCHVDPGRGDVGG